MYGTILSIIISGLLIFLPAAKDNPLSPSGLSMLFVGISLVFLLSTILIHIMSWGPLQKIEQNLTPRLLDLFRSDTQLNYISTYLLLFPVLTLLICSELYYFQYFHPVLAIALWTLLFGISIDALIHLVRRILSYLNPFAILEHFSSQAIESIQEEEDIDLLHWIDALTEIAVKAVDRTLPSLTKQAIDDLQEICHTYLDSAKSIAHHTTEKKADDPAGSDRVSYTLFYLFQRLELIHERALDQRMEPICSHLITTLGKIAIDSAHFDLSLTSYPLHYIGKLADKAQNEQLDEVTEKATCTLLEVGRIIANEVDIRYLDIKEPFFCIIQHMEEFAKHTFSQDKSINITLLTQPFHELKELFTIEKLTGHQDSPTIIADIERVINQFDQLELVIRTIPKINLPEEEEVADELSSNVKTAKNISEQQSNSGESHN
jgi:hypothetical protein